MTEVPENSVFISYSHRDREWLDRLNVHLRPLVRESGIKTWDDTKIDHGALWEAEIEEALASARVAILLISADFLASDFIAKKELPTLLSRAASNGVEILPLILSPSRLRSTPLAKFQSVNDPAKPLIEMTRAEQERVLVQLTDKVDRATATPGDSASPTSPPTAPKQDTTRPPVGSTDTSRSDTPERPSMWPRVAGAATLLLLAIVGIFWATQPGTEPQTPSTTAAELTPSTCRVPTEWWDEDDGVVSNQFGDRVVATCATTRLTSPRSFGSPIVMAFQLERCRFTTLDITTSEGVLASISGDQCHEGITESQSFTVPKDAKMWAQFEATPNEDGEVRFEIVPFCIDCVGRPAVPASP